MPRLTALLLAAVAAGQPSPKDPPVAPPGQPPWPYDEITHKSGAKFQGLVVDELPDGVRFRIVRRPPGKPTVTMTTFFARAEIAGLRRLDPADREVLRAKLAELDPRGEDERARMESLALAPADWLGTPAAARRYDSDFFTLVSPAPDEVTRRAAVRLEQVYTAFARFLPPRAGGGRPTLVRLAPTAAEYKALLAPLGAPDLLNPAVYDPGANQIVCGGEFRRPWAEFQETRLHHAQQLVRLAAYEDRVRRLYKEPELQRYVRPVQQERARVWRADRENLAAFDAAAGRLFALLYHEAFHAYAGAFVYPPLPPDQVRAGKGTGPLPRWLDEGLAQVFETAVVEAGELRAEHADEARLGLLRDRLAGKDGLVPLADLLRLGRDGFLARHAGDRAAADRAYLSSWALAHYLTFHRRVVGTDGFRAYLVGLNGGGDPRAAFERLVGQDLPAFEAAWHADLRRLRPDGTLGK